ncbi:MAG: (d)CMP kinase [Limosilactobacillus mucosae]|uniref:Cytidylate kinase n=2 Tax=Limosilactobacillus mucosae TaxID=97478 RepID=A0A0R1P3N4_LIMMU|nr:(d)CMP kinase [Limosilactobacillus mucosae]KRL26665.1 cytidylate kinase [Limosilactobacillus mucosae DSM 13345]MCI6053512.1 (d)CMP kinase [Limosilactobacillus mucosae]MDD7322714.1 (d)CMP kinase [Limosilactobacillus mucosae]QOL69222.1 (d)CMP kinase [Limosilactobacillus mucosae]
MEKGLQVAIDGPASSGKSTVAKIIAKRFGYVYCDTGAMYRSVTWAALENGIDVSDTKQVIDLARRIKITFEPGQPDQRVFVDGHEVTKDIRTEKIAANVSAVAAIPEVRAQMVEQQRQIAQAGGIVMDGRDIGTTVLPEAQVKVFLVASAHERARRRYEENLQKGLATQSLDELEAAIKLRDQKDSTRKVSPLTQAKDAILIDTTSLTIDQVVDEISALIKKNQDN